MMWKLRRLIFTIKRKIRFFFKRRKEKIGLPAYFEDTGEKIGIVKKIIRNSLGDEIGYEIETDDGNSLMLPADAFEKTKRGLIFAPLWYIEGMKLVKELELKQKLPEIHDLLMHGLDKDTLYEKIVEKYPEIGKYVEELHLLRESLVERLNDLEIRMMKLRKKIVDLSGKRLLKEIGRAEFAEKVLEARREMNIIEISMKRCKELLLRIDKIPFLPSKIEKEELLPLKKILHNIPVSMLVLDENGKIVGGNEHVEMNFGYSIDEIRNKKLIEFVVERDRDKVMEVNEKIFLGEEAEELEFEFVDKYGVHHILFGRFLGVEREGKRICVLAMQAIEEKKGLEKIFSERVAHLFFNPLSIAQGYLHLLAEERYGKLTNEQKRQLEAIARSLTRIERLVKDTIKLKP